MSVAHAIRARCGWQLTESAGAGVDGLQVWLPVAEVGLCVPENGARVLDVLKGRVSVAGDDGGVVEEHEHAAGLLGQHNLLLGALNIRGKVQVVRLLELLTGLSRDLISRVGGATGAAGLRCW